MTTAKGRATAARQGAALAFGGLLASAACSPARPVDLLKPEARRESVVAGRAVQGRAGGLLRINDVVRRTLPAGPPALHRFAVEVAEGARLTFACAVAPRFHDRPGVEFFVKVRDGGREDTVWTLLLDPLTRREHRRWVTAAADLGRYAGRRVELILDSHGYEETGEPARAVWGTPGITAPGAEAPLVVVYLVDTLRADHTGPYGYSRPTTPHLDVFARDAVVFEQAIVHASWTKPSVASIFTSLLPGQHRAVQLRDPLDSSLTTLAEMLQAKGYATGAAIANSVIYGAQSAFDQGFDFFAGLHGEDDQPSKLVGAEVVVDAALSWLEARRGFPTFLYVHTMDPHVPYAPPPPFDRMFEPHPVPGHPGQDPRTDYQEPLDRERLVAQYDGDVAYGDQEFGRFVKGLKDLGLYDRALVVFLSDHGEEFLDHGQWLHGRSVFDELVRVPLIAKFPGGKGAGRRASPQVQAVDVLPTVLENEGLPVPAGLAGRPLQHVLAGRAEKTPALSEISHRGIVAHGVRTEADKYVRRFSPERDELYFDLRADPGERTSLLDRRPERVRLLKAQAEAAMSPNPFRYVLRVAGTGRYALALASDGWIEAVETTGLGSGETWTVRENGRRLELLARPRPGQPREVTFTLRPRGAPVLLEGTRDGRPLRPAEVSLAGSGAHPDAFPFRLPDIESEAAKEHGGDLFAPPRGEPAGVQVWLALPAGRTLIELDPATRERLKAMGYLPAS